MTTRWIRSFPTDFPQDRAFISDHMERFYMTNYDYKGLAQYKADLFLLEWDMAISLEDMEEFQEILDGRENPDRVLVVPYKLYQVSTGELHSVWAHRLIVDRERGTTRYVKWGAPHCDLPAFGCIYLPHKIIAEFEEEKPGRKFTDDTFAYWYEAHYGSTDIYWGIQPVHLHW